MVTQTLTQVHHPPKRGDTQATHPAASSIIHLSASCIGIIVVIIKIVDMAAWLSTFPGPWMQPVIVATPRSSLESDQGGPTSSEGSKTLQVILMDFKCLQFVGSTHTQQPRKSHRRTRSCNRKGSSARSSESHDEQWSDWRWIRWLTNHKLNVTGVT